MTARAAGPPVPIETVIRFLRGERVILDADLAKIYGVETRVLNQAVQRNRKKFPSDFVFRLSLREASELDRSQVVIASQRHRNPRYPPYAFTEHGAIMAANVLNSPRAIRMSVMVVRAFVRMREVLAQHKELGQKLADLERKIGSHDEQIRVIFGAIRQLMAPPQTKRRPIGFQVKERSAPYLAASRSRRK